MTGALLRRGNFKSSLVVQWLGLCTLAAKGMGSMLDRGTKIPQASWGSQIKGNLDTATERRPWEDPGKRWQSASKGTRPQKKSIIEFIFLASTTRK